MLKVAKEKVQYKGNSTRLSADLSAEILQPQENGMIYSKG